MLLFYTDVESHLIPYNTQVLYWQLKKGCFLSIVYYFY